MKRFNFNAFDGKVIRVDYFDTCRLAFLQKGNQYLVITEYFDYEGEKERTIVDYCSTYIDAYFHYKSLFNEKFQKHLL